MMVMMMMVVLVVPSCSSSDKSSGGVDDDDGAAAAAATLLTLIIVVVVVVLLLLLLVAMMLVVSLHVSAPPPPSPARPIREERSYAVYTGALFSRRRRCMTDDDSLRCSLSIFPSLFLSRSLRISIALFHSAILSIDSPATSDHELPSACVCRCFPPQDSHPFSSSSLSRSSPDKSRTLDSGRMNITREPIPHVVIVARGSLSLENKQNGGEFDGAVALVTKRFRSHIYTDTYTCTHTRYSISP